MTGGCYIKLHSPLYFPRTLCLGDGPHSLAPWVGPGLCVPGNERFSTARLAACAQIILRKDPVDAIPSDAPGSKCFAISLNITSLLFFCSHRVFC